MEKTLLKLQDDAVIDMKYCVDGQAIPSVLIAEIEPLITMFLRGDPRKRLPPSPEVVDKWMRDILQELNRRPGADDSTLLEDLCERRFDLIERGILCEVIQSKICKSRTTTAQIVRKQIEDFLSCGSPSPILPAIEDVDWWEKKFWELVKLDAADPDKQSPPDDHACMHFTIGYYSNCLEELVHRVKAGMRDND